MRLGLFGGTFDPIHNGHLAIAEETRTRLDLDQVIVIPAGEPWLKAQQAVTESCHRMAMVGLAVAPSPYFTTCDIEVRRPGPTYTVDTLEDLRRQMGHEVEFYLVLGLDALMDMGRWHEPERLFELSTVVGISRPGSEEFDLGTLEAISPGASSKVYLIDGPAVDVSAVELRRRVSQGLSIKGQVPEPVEDYIYRHGLYRGNV